MQVASDQASLIEELGKLAERRDRGELSPSEFESRAAQLLGSPVRPDPGHDAPSPGTPSATTTSMWEASPGDTKQPPNGTSATRVDLARAPEPSPQDVSAPAGD